METNVGILGLGIYLPPQIRRNDWWPPEIVARWGTQRPVEELDANTPADATTTAMRQQAADPFQGAIERHVLGDDQTTLDMELAAARTAIDRADIDRNDIDLVLTETLVPPALATNAACALHHHLGLRPDCLTLQTQGAQHAFLLQLSIAESMIAAGRARCALLVQSSAASRILDYRDRLSAVFGDGATAAIVGPVAKGFGLLAAAHRTDGTLPHTLIVSVPGSTWYDEGRPYLHVADPVGMRDIIRRTVECCVESIAVVLARAGVRGEEVGSVAMHQGLPWLRRIVQEQAGLHNARAFDTHTATGHLFGGSVPSTLAAADTQGLLRAGELLVMAGGGNGMTYGATIIRWGRT